MGGPLLAGVTVVALTSLAPMALPLGTRALAITESISLYGGLAVFGGFVLYEYVISFFRFGLATCLICPSFAVRKKFSIMLAWLSAVSPPVIQ
jgi:growth hormone-inducible transmembrane protein